MKTLKDFFSPSSPSPSFKSNLSQRQRQRRQYTEATTTTTPTTSSSSCSLPTESHFDNDSSNDSSNDSNGTPATSQSFTPRTPPTPASIDTNSIQTPPSPPNSNGNNNNNNNTPNTNDSHDSSLSYQTPPPPSNQSLSTSTSTSTSTENQNDNSDDIVFPLQMYKAGIIQHPNFSLCFKREMEHSKDGITAGILTLGGVDDRIRLKSDVVFAKRNVELMNHNGWYSLVVKRILLVNEGGGSGGNGGGNDGEPKWTAVISDDMHILNSGSGIIVDSGTTDTYLPSSLNKIFMSKFKEMTGISYSNLPRTMTKEQVMKYPTIIVQLQSDHNDSNDDDDSTKDVLVSIPATHYMEYSPSDNKYTARVYLTENAGGVLGANAMMGHNVLFDVENERIGFAESDCEFDQLDLPLLVEDLPEEEAEMEVEVEMKVDTNNTVTTDDSEEEVEVDTDDSEDTDDDSEDGMILKPEFDSYTLQDQVKNNINLLVGISLTFCMALCVYVCRKTLVRTSEKFPTHEFRKVGSDDRDDDDDNANHFVDNEIQ
mmetsp:Transcript_14372/g.16715  ORF Transcript_14372/g.16715 Transcript_14372/m.16715 type:complete len:540 (-) Transcript_14372:258-1877(-)